MVDHAALANSELHEPKGIASATDGTVYVADGLGSGNWETIFEESSSALSSTGVTLTGLGDYAAVYLTTPNYRSSTNTNHDVGVQVGSSGGLTTSTVYYASRWHPTQGIENYFGDTAAYLAKSWTASTDYVEQSINLLLLNFNKERYTVGIGTTPFNRSQFADTLPKQGLFLVRENKAYDRIRVFTGTGTISDGRICAMGLKG